MTSNLFRRIPSVDRWLNGRAAARLSEDFTREALTAALREEFDALRIALNVASAKADDTTPSPGPELPDFDGAAFAQRIRTRCSNRLRAGLHPLINATGIVLHTNLGRAPLCAAAAAAIDTHAGCYSNLEFDLNTGKRGSRQAVATKLLKEITGAEDALVVNNCAAALMLVLARFCRGSRVVISRGELIEIGGSFRMPDVIAESGAVMREVGTTNRTTLEDYEQAIDPDTRMLLSSHPSNYRVVGFAATPAPDEIAALARRHDCLSALDLGSGCLVDLTRAGFAQERTVQQYVRAGIDLITISGDKLLGGPQAGIVLGRADLIEQLRASPLARAMRIDKLSLTALVETLRQYLPPNDPFQSVPVLRMLCESRDALEQRSRQTVEELVDAPNGISNANFDVVRTDGYAGGGTLPAQEIPGAAIRIRPLDRSVRVLQEQLRKAQPPIVGRLRDDALLLDLRTVMPEQLPVLIEGLRAVFALQT